MGCSTCGQRYRPPTSSNRTMTRQTVKTPVVAVDPPQGDVVPNPGEQVFNTDVNTQGLRSPLGPIIPGKKEATID